MSLRVQLDEKLERKFRENAMKKFGYTKGALSQAAQEAITNWISSNEKNTNTFEGDPIQAIDGLLKDVDIDAIKLQHETPKIWAKKVLEHVSC
jgi:hypothetical protein